jgi:eukaryotic-like serine/threonine-protein kinase
MIGRTLGHYRVSAQLGAGGMGEVYQAHDLRLGRDVALKILPESVSADPSRLERFQREARALAALDHPNIVTIFSVEEAEGVHFLTMELVRGRDLEAIRRQGSLSVPRFLDVARQLVNALESAHQRGVIHRDLKPANVMVTDDGRVKVLDFGLAKQVDARGDSDETALQTESGIVMGTAPYMSPEQVQGHPLDQRSDIFSLGVVLHELATGERPFRGTNQAALSSAILRDDPPPITTADTRLPEALANIVLRCLRKEARDRFQTAREAGVALATMDSRSASRPPTSVRSFKTVLVLPFVNRSPDPENEYFADGLTEEVIADLSGLSALRVISRNSAMTLKGTTKDTPTLARALNVTHLVTGSVRRSGQALRVTAELVDAQADAPIWSEKYSGTVEDVFGIQERISRRIVAALKLTLTESEERKRAERPSENPIVWECYQRARQEMYRWTPEAFARAHRLVDDALGIVGDNPLLLATKGQIFWMGVNTNLTPAEEGLPRASESAARALALDPALPLAIGLRGLVAGLSGRPEDALPDLHRAYGLSPGDANLLTEFCRYSNTSGLQSHRTLVDRAVQIDPLSPITWLVVSTYHWVNGHVGEIAAPALRAVEMTSAASMMHVIAAWQVASDGRRDEAVAILDRVGRTAAGTAVAAGVQFLTAALAGSGANALPDPDQMRATLRNEFAACFMADAYALAGQTDDALEWLRTSIRYGLINYPFLTEHDPFLRPLRSDPRFQALMEEVRPRWEAVVDWERRTVAADPS